MAKPNPRVIDLEPIRAGKAAKSEDAGSMSMFWIAPSAVGLGSLFGALAIFAAGVSSWVPDAPSIGKSVWVDGFPSLPGLAAFLLIVWVFCAGLVHVALGVPAKAAFAIAHVKNRLERLTLKAMEAGVIAFAAVAVTGIPVSALFLGERPQATQETRREAGPRIAHPAPPEKARPSVMTPVPRLEPVAVIPPYHSRYLRFFQSYAKSSAPHSRRAKPSPQKRRHRP